jgi:predicted RNA binding protein YcfA (HicA-like mRNA interferase family)
MNSRDVMKALKEDGWEVVNIRGSHHQFKHPTKAGRVTLPHPKKDLPLGTVRNIFRQAGIKR